MRFYSTHRKSEPVSLREAVLTGLPADKGLFMPERIPVFDPEELAQFPHWDLPEIAFRTACKFMADDVPESILASIAESAINFDTPLVRLNDDLYILELFHGPTLAFKDVGARFMARLIEWLVRSDDQKLTILVATSGDTGSAVASGFQGVEGVEVIILYPSGKVSELQEKQLTTQGQNVTALEIKGNFDDCQALVKQAFLDPVLADKFRLSSANSINISRPIPQTFYYLYAATRPELAGRDPVFSVPSGNFGNLCAGLIAQRMGAPIHHFIAATNANDVVPQYLKTGEFQPRPSIATLSNAMDVGDPSNFWRLMDLFNHDQKEMRQAFAGYGFSDNATRQAMQELFEKFYYICDPHGAVGYLGWQAWKKENPGACGVVLETAHPAKFCKVVEETLSLQLELPPTLKALEGKNKRSTTLPAAYPVVREWLLER
jgi:threonine synthase